MHRSRRTLLVGTLLTALAILLPFADLPTVGAINGIDADAWPALIPLGSALVVFLIGDRVERPATAITAIAILLTVAGLNFSAIKLLDAHRAVSDAGGSVGIGAWALPLTSGVTLVGAFLGLSRRVG